VVRVTRYVSGKRNPSRSLTPLVRLRAADPAAPEELECLVLRQSFRDHDGVLDDLSLAHPVDDLVDGHRPVELVFARLESRAAAIDAVIDLREPGVADDPVLLQALEDLLRRGSRREEDRRPGGRDGRATWMLQAVEEENGRKDAEQSEKNDHADEAAGGLHPRSPSIT